MWQQDPLSLSASLIAEWPAVRVFPRCEASTRIISSFKFVMKHPDYVLTEYLSEIFRFFKIVISMESSLRPVGTVCTF